MLPLLLLPALLSTACDPDEVPNQVVESRLRITINNAEHPTFQYYVVLYQHQGGTHWTYNGSISTNEGCTGENAGFCEQRVSFSGTVADADAAASPWMKLFEDEEAASRQACSPTGDRLRTCSGSTLALTYKTDNFVFDSVSNRGLLTGLADTEAFLNRLFRNAKPRDPEQANRLGTDAAPYPFSDSLFCPGVRARSGQIRISPDTG